MKHFIVALLLCFAVSIPAFAADDAKAKPASCDFNPQKIVLTNMIKLYSCVPIADALCSQSCGDKATSTDINTTIRDGKIGKTTIICRKPKSTPDDKTGAHDITVEGLKDSILVQCEKPGAQ